jgi:hypothetical protein
MSHEGVRLVTLPPCYVFSRSVRAGRRPASVRHMDSGSVDGHAVRCTYTLRCSVDVGSYSRPRDALVPYNKDTVASCHTPLCHDYPFDTTGIALRVVEDVRVLDRELTGALP